MMRSWMAASLVALLGVARAQPAPSPAPTSQSAFQVIPYGSVVLNAAYVLGGANNLDVPMWATPGPNELNLTVRQTRVGLKASWQTPPSALHVKEVAGTVELDFFGGFLGQGVPYYFPTPRLRLATVSVAWKYFRLTFGQDWALFAPGNPDSALHMAIPGFSATGNLWARVPQLRLDGATLGKWKLVWAVAVVASVQADAIATADTAFTGVRKPEGGENSLAPGGEARVGIAGTLFGKPLAIGVSGHVSDRSVRTTTMMSTVDVLAAGVALDALVPLARVLSFKGELYYGAGLDAFFGGINQGISFTRDMNGGIATVGGAIHSIGGWGQFVATPLSWLNLSAGVGFDRPDRSDMLAANRNTDRTTNIAFYGAFNFVLAYGFSLGVEYDFLRTVLHNGVDSNTNVVALNALFSF